jgi:hypothetical protein
MDLLDTFLHDCRDAMSAGQAAVLGVMTDALDDPQRFGAAVRARPKPWFFAADAALTVFCTDGRPGNASAPHDHGTWSVLGCFDGSEESWWHRPTVDPATGARLETVGAGILRAGQAHALDADVVHSVMNRWAAPNGVVHVYAGNFLAADRHIWDPVTGERYSAGLSEPLVPVDQGVSRDLDVAGPTIAGTAFAALAVADVESTVGWLVDVFGLQRLITHDETCAIGEEFAYLIEPASLTIIGVHRVDRDPHERSLGLDHLALRVPTFDQLEQWHADLRARGHAPTPITSWAFGDFVEVIGPSALRIRLFVPAMR